MTKNLGYTFEMAREVALGYNSKTKFYQENRSLYGWCYRRGFWDQISAHMIPPPCKRMWTEETITAKAMEFSKKIDFTSSYPGAYAAAVSLGILNKVCAHMERRLLPEEVVLGRTCLHCGCHKIPEKFITSKTNKSGYGAMCLSCHSKRTGQYAVENKDWKRAQTAKRRAMRKFATPIWLTQDQHSAMQKVYQQARLMSEKSGKPYEVDHVVPLAGRSVCGLHVPWNLQVLEKSENRKKSNAVRHD